MDDVKGITTTHLYKLIEEMANLPLDTNHHIYSMQFNQLLFKKI